MWFSCIWPQDFQVEGSQNDSERTRVGTVASVSRFWFMLVSPLKEQGSWIPVHQDILTAEPEAVPASSQGHPQVPSILFLLQFQLWGLLCSSFGCWCSSGGGGNCHLSYHSQHTEGGRNTASIPWYWFFLILSLFTSTLPKNFTILPFQQNMTRWPNSYFKNADWYSINNFLVQKGLRVSVAIAAYTNRAINHTHTLHLYPEWQAHGNNVWFWERHTTSVLLVVLLIVWLEVSILN